MRRRAIRTLIVAFAVVLLMAGRSRVVQHPARSLSATRSFEVTDKAIVGTFTLERVLTQLIDRAGVTGLTPQQLMRQLFDTQNPRPGLADAAGPHCDDFITGGVPSFNGFPRRCPTPEGPLAQVDPNYFTMGVINRFDLAPPDGSNCGQYRLVFARGNTVFLGRTHLIFEPVLPNPNPSAGLAGCRPVAQFWSDLSSVDSISERQARLETFFFEGLGGFGPVIDPANLAAPGGVRTLQESNGAVTTRFYQFRLEKDCVSGACTLRFVPDVLENMPYGLLFDATNTSTLAKAFREEFVKQVSTLAIDDLNLFHMQIPKEYLMVESNPSEAAAFDYQLPFDNALSTGAGSAFRDSIQQELDRIGSPLTPDQVLLRAENETCHACHGFNGISLGGNVKLALGFFSMQMISEETLQDGEAGPLTRYGVDPIVMTQFIPHRMQILQNFLRDGTPPVHSK